jgi:hypothetical protein
LHITAASASLTLLAIPIGPHIDATIARSLAIVQRMRFSNWRCSVEHPAKPTDIAITTSDENLKDRAMPFPKTFANVRQNTKHSAPRTPLRTFQEMAEEFGVSAKQLSGMISRANGTFPKARFTHNALSATNSWYDPAEVRAWWKLHKSSV